MANTKAWTATAVETLRRDYNRMIEEIAEALRPRFERGELHGWRESDNEMEEDESERWDGKGDRAELEHPLFVLEQECRERLCGTAEYSDGDDLSTFLVLALSPSLVECWDDSATPEGNAGEAAAYDVLRIARSRGWYEPTKDETPALTGRAA